MLVLTKIFKKMKKLNLKLLLILLLTTVIFSCTRENEENELISKPNQSIQNPDITTNRSSLSDSLFFEITRDKYIITYSTSLHQESVVISDLSVQKNYENVLDIQYEFDTNQEHWKLIQSQIVIEKASSLEGELINIENLKEINGLLEEYLPYIYSETLDKKNELIISSINYHKSILKTKIRSLETNEDCGCTTHPAYLIDKTFFNCQEDHFYKANDLKNVLDKLKEENEELDDSTLDLIEYVNTYEEEDINFNNIYSFYVSNEDYDTFINNQLVSNSSDCAWYCIIGCGSDWGCCGNYSGCCLYRNNLCWIHDALCTNCSPSWFCLPGCVPDSAQPVDETISIS